MQTVKKHIITNACPDDYENISKLFVTNKTQHFGRYRRKDTINDLFFTNYVTHRLLIPVTEAKHVILGYAEVSHAPNMPALMDDLWPQFIKFHFCCNLPLNPTNTCFLNKFVYQKDYNPEMLKQLLEEIFYRESKLKYILVLECPNYVLYPSKDIRNYYCLEGFSTIFYPKCFSVITSPNTAKLHVIMRDNILPQIRYRKALPEDNDDVVDIVDRDDPYIKERLGEYYIAEELLSNTDSLLVVTEINNLTAGFIWLNDNINILPLLENYNLQSFGNLLKFNAKERFKEKVLYVNAAQRRPLQKCFPTSVDNPKYMCLGEVGNVSNYSLFHHQLEDGDENLKTSTPRASILLCLEELNDKYKSSYYYAQVRKRQFRFFYNIPDGETNASWDARSNVFSIELFGLVNLYDPRQVFQYLSTAFAAFPNKDYCLLSMSSGKETTPIFMELLNYFIPVTLRPNCYVREHLFITHRCAVYGDLSLVAVRPQDTEDIIDQLRQEFSQIYPLAKRRNLSGISSIANRVSIRSLRLSESDSYEESLFYHYDLKPILAILKNIFKDPFSNYKCFTIRCGDSTRSIDDNKVVGFVIIRPFKLSCLLQKNFHTIRRDEFQNSLKAEIITLKLHTLFHFQANFIYRELARQTGYHYFYYIQPLHQYSLNDLLKNMQPLEPRRIKKIWFNYFDDATEKPPIILNADEYNLMDGTVDLLNDKFAVFKTNLRPTAYFGSTKNIVILGLTDICKAFLRLMIFSWHNLSHNNQSTINCLPELNITVICSPGVMEADHDLNFKCEICNEKEETGTCWTNFRNSDDFIRDVTERMDLRIWITFVSCKIKSIHSEKHLIKMKSGCEIYYEELLLMCGTEFGVPEHMFHEAERPPNYCHFNNRFDKILFYYKLQLLQNSLTENLKKSIIVYGCHVRTFEFINFLLRHDIKGSEIHLVLPWSKHARKMGLMLNNPTEDTRIEDILKEMVEDLEVQIYEHLIISGYTLRYDNKNLKEVKFRKYIGNTELTLKCDLFISFCEVFLPRPLLNIFKETFIDVEDSFVLVDENYQTSEPHIYAMGNFIKHQIEPNHQYRFVSPEEAAEKIINALGLIKTEQIEKKFSKSCFFQAQLPLNHLLIKVTLPKRYLENHLDNEYGFPMTTYNNGEFSRVRLNDRGMVEEMLFITKKKKNYDFLKFFCGRHELLLNNLKARWYLNEIVSLIDFFQEPWTELLMHDEFDKLRIIHKNLITKIARDTAQKNMSREDKRKILYGYCQDAGIKAQIEYTLLEFIRHNREDFFTDIALPEDFTQLHAAASLY